jgi:hypothetical protein
MVVLHCRFSVALSRQDLDNALQANDVVDLITYLA